jgi:hypothetical protein
MLLAVPAMIHFTTSDVVSSLGDDTISYLMLARHFLDPANALNREWVGYQAHFPPLFPLLLALTGSAWSYTAAHALVAGFAILSLVLIYRYAAFQLGSDTGGLVITALCLLMPTAWVSIHPILSESLFLFTSLSALYYYETRLHGETGRAHQWVIFGLLLGSAVLSRSAGLGLVAAYGVHAVCAVVGGRRKGAWKFLLPALPPALMLIVWVAVRPTPEGANYQSLAAAVMRDLPANPVDFLRRCAEMMFGGWIRSFSVDSNVPWFPKAVFALVAVFAMAGAILRARMNHLDGWYVLVMFPVLFLWLFPEDNMRRLLYPLMPLLLIHAATFLNLILSRALATWSRRHIAIGAVTLLVGMMSLPAWLVLQSKGTDRETIYPGFNYQYSEITAYHTTVSIGAARHYASQHAAVLSGLDALQSVTPPGARVMWVRPDYVAVLGNRRGVPWYFRWDKAEFLRQIRQSQTDYLIASKLLKTDMDGGMGDPALTLEWALQFSSPVYAARDALGKEYAMVVLKIDHAVVEEMLRSL